MVTSCSLLKILKDVQHGEVGADMQVALVNEGPCTIIIDTDEWKKKE